MDNRGTMHLPRFDSPLGGVANHLIAFDAPSCLAITDADSVETSEGDLPKEQNIPEEKNDSCKDELALLQKDVELTLAQFSHAIHEIEAGVMEKVSAAVKDIIEKIFPRLSSALLVEEFALHMPGLVKMMPISISIQAAPLVSEKLQEVALKMEQWPSDWTISGVENLSEARIEVNWENGGLSYDVDQQLSAAMAQLGI
jgi:hypothetical protein